MYLCHVDVLLSSPASPNIDLADLLAATSGPSSDTSTNASIGTNATAGTSSPYGDAPGISFPAPSAPGRDECARQYRYIQAMLIPPTTTATPPATPSLSSFEHAPPRAPQSGPGTNQEDRGRDQYIDVLSSPAPWTLPPLRQHQHDHHHQQQRQYQHQQQYQPRVDPQQWSQSIGCEVPAAAFLLVSVFVRSSLCVI
jgi:hypothetical protein